MSALRHDRDDGRLAAVQLLYASEITGEEPARILEGGAAPEEVVANEYALRLVEGVTEHRDEIDGLLEDASRNWAVSRMPLVDKCILRIAVFEMRYVDEVPVSVTINEAVDLAKQFGGEDESHRFVNGVLGRIANGSDTPADPAGEEEAGDEAKEAE